MRKPRNIRGMPVKPKQCSTCPFGPNGDQATRTMVEGRLLQVSQTCHSTGAVNGKPDTHVCRGARDWQLQILHRLGFLESPTDKCWEEKASSI
jgi:hypothetical protein